jgi:hypothetical protein
VPPDRGAAIIAPLDRETDVIALPGSYRRRTVRIREPRRRGSRLESRHYHAFGSGSRRRVFGFGIYCRRLARLGGRPTLVHRAGALKINPGGLGLFYRHQDPVRLKWMASLGQGFP